MKHLLITAALVAAASAHGQAMTSDEQGWVQAISVFQTDAKAAGMTLEVNRDTSPKSGTSPVGAEYFPGKCVIVLRNSPSKYGRV